MPALFFKENFMALISIIAFAAVIVILGAWVCRWLILFVVFLFVVNAAFHAKPGADTDGTAADYRAAQA
jgi:uncharacterized membrane protein